MNTPNETSATSAKKVLRFLFYIFLVAMVKGLIIYGVRDHNNKRQVKLQPNEEYIMALHVRHALKIQNSAPADSIILPSPNL